MVQLDLEQAMSGQILHFVASFEDTNIEWLALSLLRLLIIA